MRFLKAQVPGFESAEFSGVAPRIGIRETRRVMGDYVLTGDDVLNARKRPDGIARGGHEIDVHGAGTAHDRRVIASGGSYDIPYGTLIPRNVNNLLLAGRCLSSTREGQSSARVMGTCMAMGQAAGTAAAMAAMAAAAATSATSATSAATSAAAPPAAATATPVATTATPVAAGAVRAVSIERLRETLIAQGAVLAGVD